MMPLLLDPLTVAALAVGLATATGFLLVAAAVEGPVGRRRLARRLDAVKGQKRGAASGDKEVRSLSMRGNISKMDQVARRWMPRRELLVARLERTGRSITIGQYMVFTLILAGIIAAGITSGAGLPVLPSLLVGVGLGVALPHIVIGKLGKRRVAAFINLFPDAIDLMVRALRSGLPISEAIIMASHEIGDPIGSEFRTIESGMRLGRDLESLLWDIGKRIDAPEFRFFIIALSVQRETGGNLAETLSNLSDVLRRRRTMRAKARAMASEARASTMILGSLPFIVTIILMTTSPTYIMPLFGDIRGLALIGLALFMLATGIGIMVKMAKFEI
jgi:tight adherence protein B